MKWNDMSSLPAYDKLVLLKTSLGICTGWRDSDENGDHWCFGNRTILWDCDFNLRNSPEVEGWAELE